MRSPTIEKLIKLFAELPTVGPRTAGRFVFYLIKQPKEKINELVKTIEDLKNNIKICQSCLKTFEGVNEFCQICSDARRNKSQLAIIEKEIDLESIEKTHQFKGVYFILGNLLSSFKQQERKKELEQKLNLLINKIKKDNIKEVLLALNSTVEGQNTILWLQRKLEPLGIKTTHLGVGLPMGSELEYADNETLASSLSSRK